MVLKDYQKRAINSLEKFIELLVETKSLQTAYQMTLAEAGVPGARYQANIPNVPQVCFKVPTGGGKTFMAAASLKPIHSKFPSKIIVWIVPSETILSQTYKNLSDKDHDYCQKIFRDFGGQIRVYTKEQLLAGENFSPREVDEQISILVLSYDSFRRKTKDGYKVFQENPHFNNFSAQIDGDIKLDDAAEVSLINTIRSYNPIVIVDESHHATTDLSIEMLKNFNPSFILELTATPKKTSNVICYVSARELKKENMVKLPIIEYNFQSRVAVISHALTMRYRLEEYARACKEKIRPIILFQAESKGKEDRATFDKIKYELINDYHIPSEQIAIKTATINDLKNIDLMAADCPIRYIITINALKEGWDCPFAYILASLANRSSAVDVEQIVGRIMRQPYTKNFSEGSLNHGYIFTASDDFHATLGNVIEGLKTAGFSEKDCRVSENLPAVEPQKLYQQFLNLFATQNNSSENQAGTKIFLTSETAVANFAEFKVVENFFEQAKKLSEEYDKDIAEKPDENYPPEVKDKMKEFSMQPRFKDAEEILLPQFFCKETESLFETDIKISRVKLCNGFSLDDKDTEINFEDTRLQIVEYDVREDNDFVLRGKRLFGQAAAEHWEHFKIMSQESKVQNLAAIFAKDLDKIKPMPSYGELKRYIEKILSKFSSAQLQEAFKHQHIYRRAIEDKIDGLLSEYASKNFSKQIDSKKIFAKPSYKLPNKIMPIKFTDGILNTLYEAEENDMNRLEKDIILSVASLDNVRWWHRNRAKKDFFINGFINHYPDFLIMMESGILLIVEVKGDDRDNSDSMRKLKLGKLWESKASSDNYSYFMVFDKNPIEGALNFNDFVSRVKAL